MKTKYSTIVGALGLGLALSTTPVMYADQATALKETLSTVALPDLPAQAAKLVTDAKAKEQKSVTIAVVRAAVERDPAAAPLIVSAVAKAVPAVASVAAATASAMVPNQARAIAKAAAAAAPSQAKEIVLAIYKELHGSYAAVAIGASEGAPASSQQILALIPKADAIASSQSAGTPPAVQPPPPGNGGPFVPGTQGNGDPQRKQTVIVQPGQGRLYSGP